MSEYVICLDNIKLKRSGKTILDIKEFKIKRGELTALIGPNGAGKSTLLKVINLVEEPQCGKVTLFGQDAVNYETKLLRQRSAMVYQEAILLNDTVYNNVALGLYFRGCGKQETKKKVYQAMQLFRCEHLVDRRAHSLSGGEAQRVCLARAFAYEPELLLLDEPFSALDVLARTTLLNELREIVLQKKMTVLMVSHNFEEVLHFADRVIIMSDGKVVQDDKPEIVMRYPKSVAAATLACIDNVLDGFVKGEGAEQRVYIDDNISFAVKNQIVGKVVCCIPGDAMQVNGHCNKDKVKIDGIVERIIPGVGIDRIKVRAGKLRLVVIASKAETSDLQSGERLFLCLDPEGVQLVYN